MFNNCYTANISSLPSHGNNEDSNKMSTLLVDSNNTNEIVSNIQQHAIEPVQNDDYVVHACMTSNSSSSRRASFLPHLISFEYFHVDESMIEKFLCMHSITTSKRNRTYLSTTTHNTPLGTNHLQEETKRKRKDSFQSNVDAPLNVECGGDDINQDEETSTTTLACMQQKSKKLKQVHM